MQNTSDDMVETVKRKIQENLVDGRKKIKNHFPIEFAHSALSAGDELLHRSPDVQGSLEKCLTFL